MYKAKEKKYRKGLYVKLKSFKINSKEFWKFVQDVDDKNKTHKCTITNDKWLQYYKNLLNQDVNSDEEFMSKCMQELEQHNNKCLYCNGNDDSNCEMCTKVKEQLKELNDVITSEEVTHVIANMKKGKSPGYDGLVIELFQKSVDIIDLGYVNYITVY